MDEPMFGKSTTSPKKVKIIWLPLGIYAAVKNNDISSIKAELTPKVIVNHMYLAMNYSMKSVYYGKMNGRISLLKT